MNLQAPFYSERQKRRDGMMDALVKAKRHADYDDWEIWDDGQDTEVCLQTFVAVRWETVGCGIDPSASTRAAIADVIGARLGNILLDRETLDTAFPDQVDRLEEHLSEKITAWGED